MPSPIKTLSPFQLFSGSAAADSHPQPTAAGEGYVMKKPTLSPVRRILAVNQEVLALSEKMLEGNITQIGDFRIELSELTQKQAERMHESLKHHEKSRFWGILAKIGSVILSAASVVFGVTLISTGAGVVMGGAMVAAGLAAIANVAMDETGGWDFVAQQMFRENQEHRILFRALVPAAVGVVCGLATLGGTGIAGAALGIGGRLATVAQVAGSLAVGITTGAKGIHLAQASFAEAAHGEAKKDMFLNQTALEELTLRTVAAQKSITRELNTAARILHTQS